MRTPSRMTPIPHPYPLYESHYIRFMKSILLFFLIYEYHIWNKQEFVMQMRNFLDKIDMRNPRLNYGMRMLIVSKLPSTIWISNFFFYKTKDNHLKWYKRSIDHLDTFNWGIEKFMKFASSISMWFIKNYQLCNIRRHACFFLFRLHFWIYWGGGGNISTAVWLRHGWGRRAFKTYFDFFS